MRAFSMLTAEARTSPNSENDPGLGIQNRAPQSENEELIDSKEDGRKAKAL
jgi:hypothetical protein